MAVWNDIPIEECGEPMVRLDDTKLKLLKPHPYHALGAPYGDVDPFFMRENAAHALLQAQIELDLIMPGAVLLIYDAYRPVAVQRWMIEYTRQQKYREKASVLGMNVDNLSQDMRQEIDDWIDRYWADPSDDPMKPPPHSTGGAIDLTIVKANGDELDMGVPIDHLNTLSTTRIFENSANPVLDEIHHNRMLLVRVMENAGFIVNTKEWWHFDMGTQKAVYEHRLRAPNYSEVARYGRYDLVKS